MREMRLPFIDGDFIYITVKRVDLQSIVNTLSGST